MNFLLIVDNSWLSVALNCFDHGADIIVESLSKYMGDGLAIGGALIGDVKNAQNMERIAAFVRLHGCRMSQFDCYQIEQKMGTLHFRLEKAGTIALEVANFLAKQPFILNVDYPLLESHSSFTLSKEYLPRHGPGVLSFAILMPEKNCRKMISSSSKILCATSYGKSHTLFDPYPHSFRVNIPGKSKSQSTGNHIRLALGYGDSSEEIIAELARLFQIFCSSH